MRNPINRPLSQAEERGWVGCNNTRTVRDLKGFLITKTTIVLIQGKPGEPCGLLQEVRLAEMVIVNPG